MSNTQKTPIVQAQRVSFMHDLCEVVRETGEQVLKLGPNEMHDIVVVDRHSFSNVDSVASSVQRGCIEKTLRGFTGTVMEECDIARLLTAKQPISYPLLICDAVEGSTNTKRGLATHVRRPILGGTSIVMLESERMATVIASAFYDFASGYVFSSVRGESGSFISFIDGKIILSQGNITECRGDSQAYAVVAGYSNDNVDRVAEIMKALLAEGIRWDGGTRSSAQDLLNILCNEVDAYIDLRAVFSDQTKSADEVLHFWDVGGLLPLLDGLGFFIVDHKGTSWQDYVLGEKLTLIVSRSSLKDRIMHVISQLSFLAESDKESPVVPFSASS